MTQWIVYIWPLHQHRLQFEIGNNPNLHSKPHRKITHMQKQPMFRNTRRCYYCAKVKTFQEADGMYVHVAAYTTHRSGHLLKIYRWRGRGITDSEEQFVFKTQPTERGCHGDGCYEEELQISCWRDGAAAGLALWLEWLSPVHPLFKSVCWVQHEERTADWQRPH